MVPLKREKEICEWEHFELPMKGKNKADITFTSSVLMTLILCAV